MMDDEMIRLLAERTAQSTPIADAAGRTEFAPERVAIPRREEHTPSSVESPDPYLISLLGGLADNASTYTFLKRGTGREDNKLVSGLADKPGTMAALGAAANVALPLLLKHTLGKKFPKIARALAANQGALQMGYGALNTQHTMNPRTNPHSEGQKSSTQYSNALLAEMKRSK